MSGMPSRSTLCGCCRFSRRRLSHDARLARAALRPGAVDFRGPRGRRLVQPGAQNRAPAPALTIILLALGFAFLASELAMFFAMFCGAELRRALLQSCVPPCARWPR